MPRTGEHSHSRTRAKPRARAASGAGQAEPERPQGEDLYATLGVPRDARIEDIKRAFKLLALRHHPDKAGGDAAAVQVFQRVSFAYSVLSDARKKRYYDETGDTEDIDVSAAEFVATFKDAMDGMLGGLSVQDMLKGLTTADIRSMPPFPFPERLFPAGTFPAGMRFSADFKLPPAVEELLEQSGPEALHALLSSAGVGNAARRGEAFRESTACEDSESFSCGDSSGWRTDDGVSDTDSQDSHPSFRDQPRGGDTGVGDVGLHAPVGITSASHDSSAGRRWLEAAKAGQLDIMQQLLPGSRELWAHRGPGLGHTALHWAAAHNNTATLNWLLVQPGADVNTRNNVGATAVHAAAGNNAVASLQILAAAGADMRVCDDAEETARDVAMRLKRADALAFLDAAGGSRAAKVTPSCELPVTSPQASASATVADLPRPPPDIAAAARPEMSATGPPDVGAVDKAVGRRWIEAARSGDVRSLSELLNSEPRLLYYWGAGTNYGFSGHSALHWAAAKGHTLAVQMLLRAGTDPDVPNHGGGRPLHASAANGQMECARVLILQGGASTSLRNGLDELPRELAFQFGHTDTANLIEAAARAAQLRGMMTAEVHEFRGAAMRAAQAALAMSGHDMRALTERDDVFAAAKQLVASLPPLLRHSSELVAVPLAKPAAFTILPTANPATASTAVPCADADEADASPTARSKLADAAKARGNAAFAAKEYCRATAAYTVALRFDRGNAVLLSNRSAALAALGKYEEALEDAEHAVRAAPKWGKGHARRGAALIGLGQAGEAVKAYAAGLAVEPDAAYLREGLAEAKQAIREAQARYSAMWGDQSCNEQRGE